MATIKDLIQRLIDDNATKFDAATPEEIDFASSFLTSNKFAPIPDDYASFLEETDGLCWNGVEFFGTSPKEREAHDYTLPSLSDINTNFTRKKLLENRLIIAAAAEEMIVYDGRFKQFQIVRRFNFDLEEIHPNLYEALEPFMEQLP